MPLAYKGMSQSFGAFNGDFFTPPDAVMRQPCGGRKPCDETDPGFRGHDWTPDGALSEGQTYSTLVLRIRERPGHNDWP